MATTIQISEGLQDELARRKLSDRETYEEVIWAMVEDTEELSEQAKKDLSESREEIRKGKFHTLAQIKKELRV